MPAPTTPFQPYASLHTTLDGPGDARPTALQIIKDSNLLGSGLKGKSILITGCSSGIGVETARALYAAGATLYLTARDIPKLEKVIDDIVANPTGEAKDATFKTAQGVPRPVTIELHLDSLAGVRKGIAEFEAKSKGELNILIENAGVMACPYNLTVDGLETQIGTNHFAHFVLFQAVKPLLLATAEKTNTLSRVVTVSSAGHRFGGINFDDIHYTADPSKYSKWGAYGQSKTANIYLANAIHRRYGNKGLTALSVHPGGIMTELGRHLDEADVKQLAPGGWDDFAKIFKNPEQGAATTVWAAVSAHFDDVKNGGRYCADVGECGPAPAEAAPGANGYAPHAYDEASEEKLWKLSCETVGIKDE
ncbi:hypothetical protein R9X50_00774200 [Acrodontium crateriforme]|uniref:Short-chain dehydrogenase n=1 Tax=Acrodontium crateriforme TaxID=150365 RepID=A0AAQ3RCX4_9PEZI|nr:hypothetical protein R9X50_00774200 [Acrodontium crateriforme]